MQNILSSVELNMAESEITDIAEILNSYKLKYELDGLYYKVGELVRVQGWILHVSVIKSQITEVLEMVIPYLASTNVPFKVIRTIEFARGILSGELGVSKIGKILVVYPNNDDQYGSVARDLISLTKGYRGPAVLTDMHLGSTIYARYGSHSPILKTGPDGQLLRYIYDQENTLIQDKYQIPFAPPSQIPNPFVEYSRPIATAKILNKRYLPIKQLKSDPKGDVIKALYFNKWLKLKWCVLKQGKINMICDMVDRDATDRINWQIELHNFLKSKVNLPKVIDQFSIDGDRFVVLEYIKGKPFYDWLVYINPNRLSWSSLSIVIKLKIFKHLMQIINITDKMHGAGIIHRDITPVNFLLTKKEVIIPIDIELGYNYMTNFPCPPFTKGTLGYMSPEQNNMMTPTVKDDIYALGALIIYSLVGLPPSFFLHDDSLIMAKLHFFMNDAALESTVILCISKSLRERPDVKEIYNAVQTSQRQVEMTRKTKTPGPYNNHLPDKKLLLEIISAGISGLVNKPVPMRDDVWYSKAPSSELIHESHQNEYSKMLGLYEGISGTIYFLSRAKMAGVNVSSCSQAYQNSLQFLLNSLDCNTSIPPGLYRGYAGITLALNAGLNAGLVQKSMSIENKLSKELAIDTEDISLATGIVGIGISSLLAKEFLTDEKVKEQGEIYVGRLLKSQHKNASWISLRSEGEKEIPYGSFAYGDAGIIWYLLELYKLYHIEDAYKMAFNALNLLIKQVKKYVNLLIHFGLQKTEVQLRSGDTLTGTVLVLLKAFEVTQRAVYKENALLLLNALPDKPVFENLALDNGLADFGEMYLEAFKIIHDEKLLDRAGWIANVLIYSSIESEKGSRYWLSNNCLTPTADFMVGNAGILHFLIRYSNPSVMSLRILQ